MSRAILGLGASVAAMAFMAGGMIGGADPYEREYQPPSKPVSNRQKLALEKALRRQARQSQDPRP